MQALFDRRRFVREVSAVSPNTSYLQLIEQYESLRGKYLPLADTTADRLFIARFVNEFTLRAAIDTNQSFDEIRRLFETNCLEGFINLNSQVCLNIEYAECCKDHQQLDIGEARLDETKSLIIGLSDKVIYATERTHFLRMISQSMKRLKKARDSK